MLDFVPILDYKFFLLLDLECFCSKKRFECCSNAIASLFFNFFLLEPYEALRTVPCVQKVLNGRKFS